MKNKKRREKTGEMLFDITKYILTIGLISGILSNKVNILTGILISIVAIILFLIAFFVTPSDNFLDQEED